MVNNCQNEFMFIGDSLLFIITTKLWIWWTKPSKNIVHRLDFVEDSFKNIDWTLLNV